MKKSLIATLVAAPLLSLSSMAFAAEPMQLTEAQLDGVTAGFNIAGVYQYNTSPVTVVQANVLSYNSANVAYIASGNFSYLKQH
jgi:hypothetical protein